MAIPDPSPEQLRWVVEHNLQIVSGHRAQILASADAWANERAECDQLRAEVKSFRDAFNAHLAACPMSKAPGGIGG